MKTILMAGIVTLGVAFTGLASNAEQPSFTTLDREAQPFLAQFWWRYRPYQRPE